MFKGLGTINGEGSYKFMLSAIDGDLFKDQKPDTFRIKIWDASDDNNVIYDNEIGVAEDAEPSTILSGGSIMIHKK